MKKLLLSILFILFVSISFGQIRGYTVEATDYMILQGDTIRTNSPIDGEIIKRVSGVWTNGTGGVGSAAVDSLVWNFASGYVGWYISGSVSDSISLDGRYVEISDTLSGGMYYSQNQVDNLLTNAQNSVFEITLPVNSILSGSVAAAVESTEGTDDGDYPFGWVLTANGSNLEVNHGLGRYSANITVKNNTSGDSYRQYRNFQDAYSGILDVDNNNVTIESLTDDYKYDKIKIFILFK